MKMRAIAEPIITQEENMSPMQNELEKKLKAIKPGQFLQIECRNGQDLLSVTAEMYTTDRGESFGDLMRMYLVDAEENLRQGQHLEIKITV